MGGDIWVETYGWRYVGGDIWVETYGWFSKFDFMSVCLMLVVIYQQSLRIYFIRILLSVLNFQRSPSLHFVLLFLFEIHIISFKVIDLHENQFSGENLSLNYFFVFARINFCEESYFTYIQKIRFGEFRKKDILPVAVTFCVRLDKGVYKASQRLDLHDSKNFKFLLN